jgi:rRNA maturation RNase YbeY
LIAFSHADSVFRWKYKLQKKRWLKELIASFACKCGDVNIIACSDRFLLEMNKTYLNHDYLTDIITFDYSLGDVISGDLFISIERVAENASNFNEDFNTELNRVIAHGVLHLLGLKDKNKKDSLKMRMAEEEALILLKQLIVSE